MWKSITDRISGKKCMESDETNSQKGVVFVHMSGGKGSGFRDGFAVCRSQTELTRSARSRTKQIAIRKVWYLFTCLAGKVAASEEASCDPWASEIHEIALSRRALSRRSAVFRHC